MADNEHEFWCVMFNHDGHLSLTPSDGQHTPFGTKVYNDIWTVVATDFKEADARAYIRMNWKDMTPHSVAKTLRDMPQHKYKDMTDEEFEALWYRQTLEEFRSALPSFLRKEEEEKEAEKAAAEAAKLAAKEAEEDEEA